MFHWYLQESMALTVKESLAFDTNDRETFYQERLKLNCPPTSEWKTNRLKSLGDQLDKIVGSKND